MDKDPQIEDRELQLAELKRRIQRAQQHVRKYVKAGRSLADELIAERRESVKRSVRSEDASGLRHKKH